ncbi:hypothetical protein U9M48_005625 [Paspalum notatum var. saurae]|uniref:Uncharacterized protein n=1 Tax=Paspalum notatum var. saurae TaxID=547442 RepID=A0AAQ3SLG1_PASNO
MPPSVLLRREAIADNRAPCCTSVASSSFLSPMSSTVVGDVMWTDLHGECTFTEENECNYFSCMCTKPNVLVLPWAVQENMGRLSADAIEYILEHTEKVQSGRVTTAKNWSKRFTER